MYERAEPVEVGHVVLFTNALADADASAANVARDGNFTTC
jgi:hypothetical protein